MALNLKAHVRIDFKRRFKIDGNTIKLLVSGESLMFPALLLLIQLVFTWGPAGHESAAQLTYSMLTLNSKRQLNLVLPEIRGNLARASVWADEVKTNPKYKWSGRLHFVDTKNRLSDGCGYDDKRE